MTSNQSATHIFGKLSAQLAIAFIVIAVPLTMIALLHYHLPYCDSWDDVTRMYLQYTHHTLPLKSLLARHNEHRLLLTRLIYFANALFAPHSTVFVQLTSYALFIMCFALIIYYFQRTARLFNQYATHPAFYLLLALILFPSTNLTYWRWGFVVQFPLTLLFTLLSLFCIQSQISWRRLTAVMACAILATCSSANGLIVWLIGLPLLLAYGNSWRKITCFSLVALTTIVSYLQDGATQHIIFSRPIKSLAYFVSFLGNPIGFQTSRAITVLFGSIICVLFFILAYRGYRRLSSRQWQAFYPWCALALFSYGNAFVGSVTRVLSGPGQATSPRYVSFSAMLYIAIAVLAKLQWPSFNKLAKRSLIGIIFLFVLLTGIEWKTVLNDYNSNYSYSTQEIALPYGIFLPQDNSTYPPGNVHIAKRLASFRHSALYALQTPRPNYLNRKLTPSWINNHCFDATAVTQLTITKAPAHNYADLRTGSQINGSIEFPKTTSPLSRSLLLLNKQHRVIGIAFVALPTWRAQTNHGYRIFGFSIANQKIQQILWLHKPQQIQQDLSRAF
ncbi:MAG: hypothetical protein P1U34_02835 [Coxiellaceae bacterium]|nr:hypothetical protein [Coxiellaceae bacterium]